MDANNPTNTNDFDNVINNAKTEGWLPGFVPCPSRGGGTLAPQGADAMPQPAAGWWVRSGKKQKLDKFGNPSGFTHDLMFGNRLIKSGRGADDHRQFEAQVAFANENGVLPSNSRSKSC